jgi:RimJ/RimL family protein N-acetyltransferase
LDWRPKLALVRRLNLRAIRLEPLLPTTRASSTAAADILQRTPNGDQVAGEVASVVEAQLALYARIKAAAPWTGYLARDEQTRELVGSCSFIAEQSSRSIEIAYFTFPPFEGQGIATAMARELLALADRYGNPGLHAFTLPEKSASSSLLQKLGFTQTGEGLDDEVGLVWRWERPPRTVT